MEASRRILQSGRQLLQQAAGAEVHLEFQPQTQQMDLARTVASLEIHASNLKKLACLRVVVVSIKVSQSWLKLGSSNQKSVGESERRARSSF
jgi:hypothetical protein